MNCTSKKGVMHACDSYRDITIGDNSGKFYTRHIRRKMKEGLQNASYWSQFGSGLNTGSTDYAHLYIKAAMDRARVTKRSIAILFLDVIKGIC